MSQHYVTIVDIDTSLEASPAQTRRMLAWLQAEGIVGDGVRAGDIYRQWLLSFGGDTASELVNDDRIVYRPGPHVHKACSPESHLDSLESWLEVDIKRQVFDAGEYGLGVLCPSCGSDQTEHSQGLGSAIENWFVSGSGQANCEACGAPHRCSNGGSTRSGLSVILGSVFATGCWSQSLLQSSRAD
jgi:hypothetical protein